MSWPRAKFFFSYAAWPEFMRPRSQGNRGCASARRTEMNRAAGSRVLYKYVTRKHTENAHPFLLRSSLSIPSHLAVVLPLPARIFPPVSSSRPATLDFERSSRVSACFSTSLSACFIISASASEAFFDAISSDLWSSYFRQSFLSVFENLFEGRWCIRVDSCYYEF